MKIKTGFFRQILKKLLPFLASFLMLFQSLAPAAVVYAQEVTDPVSDPVVADASSSPAGEAVVEPSPTPTDEPSPEVVASPEPTVEPSPDPVAEPSSDPLPLATDGVASVEVASTLEPTPEPSPEITGDESLSVVVVSESELDASLLSEPFAEPSASLATDKADYAPTDAALITGSNLLANATYLLRIWSNDEPATNTEVNVTADDSGTFTYAYQLDGNYRPNYSAELKDSGGTVVATVTFTDANPSANLDQCANDPAPSPSTDGCSASATDWVNGNLGASKSVYFEGDSIPYRLTFGSLSLASHTVTIEWDTTKSGKHAIDYLTTFNRTVATANPCLGVSPCASPTTFAIPADAQVTGAGVTPVAGNFTLYGGTITGVSAYSYPDGTGFTGDKSARITITFTASQANPVLAWGGHIATRSDWGPTMAATAISGSPYHTRLIDLDGSGGNQDRSLSADAVIFPASITIIKDATPNGSTSFSYTASPSPLSNFSLVDDGTSANTRLFSNITNFQTYSVSETVPGGWALNSIVCSVTSPNGGSQMVNLPGVSVNLQEGENVTCTFANTQQQGTLRVIKNVINDDGGTATASNFNLHVKSGSVDVSGSPAVGSSTGTVYTLNSGTYVVSEDTPPSGYTQTGFSGDCDSTGAVTVVAGTEKTCTLTNDDQQAYIIVNKTVVNDNGGSAQPNDFLLTVDGNAVSDEVAYAVNPGTHTAGETNLPGYTAGAWGGDCNSQASVTVALGETKTCTITNDDNAPSLTLVKVVENDNGGTATPANFTLTALGPTGFSGVGPSVSNGASFDAGTYALSESSVTGYSASSWVCVGGTQDGSNVTVGLGQSATCTITNTDNAPKLTLNKIVVNDNGGNAPESAWTLTASGPTTISGPGAAGSTDLVSDASFDIGTYVLSESVGLAGYSASGWTCSNGDNDGTVNIALGDDITCSITNDDDVPGLHLRKTITKDNGGTALITGWTLTATGTGQSPTNLSGATPVDSGSDFKADTYALAEINGPSGYSAGAWDCGQATMPDETHVTVPLGEDVTCAINNNDDAPSLTLVKVVDNNNGGTAVASSWTLTASGPTGFSGAGPTVSNGASFDAGTYDLSESAALPGYTNGTIWVCVGGTQNDADTVTLGLGESATCTITNDDQVGHLIVHKITIPSDTTTQFSITAAGSGTIESPATKTITGGSSVNYTVDAGTYDVTEATLSGWDETDNTCVDVVVANGETEECTITNTQRGHIIIVKDVIGNPDPTDFTFNNDFGNDNPATFLLDEDNDGTLPSSRDFEVLPGTYAVSEDPVVDWQLEDATCTDGSLVSAIEVSSGETVTCTFVNEELVEIVLIKNTVGGDGDFDFDATGAGLPADIDLTTVAGTATQTFTGLDQDNSYSILENVPAGWALTDASCDRGETPDDIDIEPGETVTCTFTNNKPAAQIDLDPLRAANKIGDDHVITAAVQVHDGSGSWGAAADGTLVTFALDNSNGATASFVGGVNTCTTTAGTCFVTINSPTAGNVSISASSAPVILGVTVNVATGTGGDNSTDAQKDYVNARISITPDASTNEVGDAHDFKVTVEQDTGLGFVPVPEGTVANAIATPSPSPDGGLDVSDCNDGVNVSGQCTVTINSSTAGVFTIIARSTVNVGGVEFKLQTNGVGENSEPAEKTYVDASIELSPQEATNNIDDPHTITAHVTQNDGSGVTDTEGVTVVFTVTSGTATFVGSDNDCVTDASGTCSVQIVDSAPGANTIDATVTLSVGGVSLTRATDGDFGPDGTDSAEKTYEAGRIIIEKQTDPDQSEQEIGQSFTFNPSWSENFNLTDDQQNESGWLAPGIYSIEEIVPEGWDLTDAVCVVNEEEEFDPRADEFILNADDIIHCTFTNTQRGRIIVTKYNDEDGDGELEGENPVLADWTINVGEESGVTDGIGTVEFPNLRPGFYPVGEDLKTGWEQTNLYCSSEETNGIYFRLDQEIDGFSTYVSPGETVYCSVLNHSLTPIITITKQNNAVGDQNPGNSVLYTITVALNEEGGPANGVEVVDLLPGGFVYVAGSWTSESNVRGNLKALAVTTEPTYASPGTWNLGDMVPGEVVILTLLAKISDGQQAGLFKDVAWAAGESLGGETVLALAQPLGFVDTNFVGTEVNVVRDTQSSTSYKVEGEVLGIKTELPATGASAAWLLFAASSMLLGGTLVAAGFRMRRRYA